MIRYRALSTAAQSLAALALAAASALLWNPSGVRAADGGNIRIVHAVPDAPALDVYVNGAKVFTGVAFKQIPDYAPAAAGPALIQAVATGRPLAQGPFVISTTTTVKAGIDYTVLLLGRPRAIETKIIEDDNSVAQDGRVRVRFVHASPDAPAVDVVLPGNEGKKLFSNVPFKSITPYEVVDGGSYNFAIKGANTDVTALDVKGVTMDAPGVFTIYAFGMLVGEPKLSVGLSSDTIFVPFIPVTGGEPANMDIASDTTVPLALLLAGLGLLTLRRRIAVKVKVAAQRSKSRRA